MKTFFTIILIITGLHLSAQLKYKYNNSELNLPEWLTNSNYISENKPDLGDLDIEEIKLATFHEFDIVELRMFETQYASGTNTIYLGTFGKNKQIKDITFVADLSSSAWNWQGELSFEEIEPGIVKYYCVDLKYKPTENQEVQQENGDMVLSQSDTSIIYFKIDTKGNIGYSSDLKELKQQITAVKANSDTESSDQDTWYKSIRTTCADINNNLTTFQKKVKKSGENITITNYYEGNILKKIAESNSSNGQIIEYYYNKDGLIFIFTINTGNKSESRYYFHNNKLIKWLKGNQKETISPDSIEFKEKEKTLLERSKIRLEN